MVQSYKRLTQKLVALPRSLRWLGGIMLLSAIALGGVELLRQSGLFFEAELWQVQMLASHPFYMSAQEAQISLLSPASTCWICALLAPYASLVLLREKGFARQCLMVFLALLVMVVASLSAVFVGGVLNLMEPMCCLLMTWALCGLARLLHLFHCHLVATGPSSQE